MSNRKRQIQSLQSLDLPELKEKQILCQVQGPPKGSNHFDVWDGSELRVAELPARFRKSAWIKRGSYVIVELVDTSSTSKINGEIIQVLLAEHVKEWKKRGDWPLPDGEEDLAGKPDTEAAERESSEETVQIVDKSQDSDVETDEEPLWENPNRR
ncbi:hypothetical protein BOTBODRAFT_26739 [Botryobasidium botryosum FD-172 SS1]|uniref:S1-like domain-containing protein n=1 Tax=Botryobasidium botryosum (strain FD-172 SS1) TaxID=930990 RepID=A0A067MY90_BOTB1|nr:hypothetical protein BOTBODRAFT_26739 [Botryobasidium botryosum FD-172 SS1]